MAVEGNLKDMSLVSLVQAICLEQRKAVLVLNRRERDVGVLVFDRGDVVHASVGALAGEEAFYQLLAWADGAFLLSDHAVAVRRTITTPWNHLLLEGMKRLDHQETAADAPARPEKPLSAAEIEQDNILESEMVVLLSRLEQLWVRLARQKGRKRPPIALETLTTMVNQAAVLAEKLDAEGNAGLLTRTLLISGSLYPAAGLLQEQGNRLSVEMVTRLYGSWSRDPAGRQQTFGLVAQSLLAILERFFALFVSYFHSAATAGQWQETCRILLAEMARVVAETQF